jgi:hypothetical protein
MMEVSIDKLNQSKEYVLQHPIPMPQYQSGRSIVTSCYRAEIPGMFILLKELQRLEFNVPIEVFYREGELEANEISELTNVWPGHIEFKRITANAKDFKDRWGNAKGWSTKVHAIIESKYAENFWIDGDNFPIRNCIDLFNDPEYQVKGSLFWRDVYSIDRANQYHDGGQMWQIFDVEPNDGEPFESGQFLINKPAVWQQLSMMLHFTENCEIYYNFGGDAECWRMAWQYVAQKNNGYHARFNYHASDQVPYGLMPYGPFHKGVQNPWHKYGGGTVMVQRDRSGKELFNHRNITKFRWKGENPYNDDVQNEMTYHMIMRHLKTRYGVSDD